MGGDWRLQVQQPHLHQEVDPSAEGQGELGLSSGWWDSGRWKGPMGSFLTLMGPLRSQRGPCRALVSQASQLPPSVCLCR